MRLLGFLVLCVVALGVAVTAGYVSPHTELLGVSAADVGHAVRWLAGKFPG